MPYSLRSACWPKENNQILCAWRAIKKFRNFYIFKTLFVKLLRKFCVVLTPDAYSFRPGRTSDFTNIRSDVTKLSKFKILNFMIFFLRKARRNSGNFAKLSQDFGTKFVSSRRCAAAFSDLNALLTQSRASMTPYVLRSARWPKKSNFVRVARRNSGIFAILS